MNSPSRLSVIGYILLLYFMLRFFRNYKRISVTDSVKGHLSTILNTRRAVNQYIYFSILGILLVFLIVVVMYSALRLSLTKISLHFNEKIGLNRHNDHVFIIWSPRFFDHWRLSVCSTTLCMAAF